MTNDIVEKLREFISMKSSGEKLPLIWEVNVMCEARDEIEKLRAALSEMSDVIKRVQQNV